MYTQNNHRLLKIFTNDHYVENKTRFTTLKTFAFISQRKIAQDLYVLFLLLKGGHYNGPISQLIMLTNELKQVFNQKGV